ncbi:hypothetical protein [Kitasatospora sp. A2-31]|uniref:hypothetical protein n=1 Tax=Kitasatospora sp. A2-31 TaxID=2916414 RepID=UPI001EEAA770|nr:hypothetical protein [Kitasatospora sp. A2-31]MCG6496933.1 hypothetical protein [Kitasatospora sp. A2-31]
MPDDTTLYIDHADLRSEDFTAFEKLLAAHRDRVPCTDPDWESVMFAGHLSDGKWHEPSALFTPSRRSARAASAAEKSVLVYFDEDGRALPDRPRGPAPDSALATHLAEHLPLWSAEPCHLTPGRDLADLQDETWGWRAPWTTTAAPHDAAFLTGPAGERLLAVQMGEDSPLIVGAAVPEGLGGYNLGSVRRPGTVSLAAGAAPAALGDAINDTLAPQYQRALWEARTVVLGFAAEDIRYLGAARSRSPWRHVETILANGPHLVAGIRAATVADDHLDPRVRPQLRTLHTTADTLARIQEIRTAWKEAAATAPGAESAPERRRLEELRDHQAWPYALQLANGPLPDLAAHVTARIGAPVPDPDETARAARARSARRPTHASPPTGAAPATTPQPGPRCPAR